MALPVLGKTWQFDVNNLTVSAAKLTHNKTLFLSLKNKLKGFGTLPWTVQLSSNATVANSSDNWTTISDIVGVTAPGTAHSWIVLRNASGQEICFDCVDASSGVPADIGRITLVYSHAATFTGGTTLARPTATDESQQFTAASGGWLGTETATPIDTRLHIMHTTDGRCTRIFMCRAGVVFFWWQTEHIKNPATGHTLPYGYRFTLATSETSRTGRGFLSGATTNMSSRISTTNINLFGHFIGRDTAVASSVFGEAHAQVADETDGGLYCYEVPLFSSTTTHRGPKGVLFDIYAGQSPPATTGDHYPADSSRQFVHMGNFIHPWNGTVILLS